MIKKQTVVAFMAIAMILSLLAGIGVGYFAIPKAMAPAVPVAETGKTTTAAPETEAPDPQPEDRKEILRETFFSQLRTSENMYDFQVPECWSTVKDGLYQLKVDIQNDYPLIFCKGDFLVIDDTISDYSGATRTVYDLITGEPCCQYQIYSAHFSGLVTNGITYAVDVDGKLSIYNRDGTVAFTYVIPLTEGNNVECLNFVALDPTGKYFCYSYCNSLQIYVLNIETSELRDVTVPDSCSSFYLMEVNDRLILKTGMDKILSIDFMAAEIKYEILSQRYTTCIDGVLFDMNAGTALMTCDGDVFAILGSNESEYIHTYSSGILSMSYYKDDTDFGYRFYDLARQKYLGSIKSKIDENTQITDLLLSDSGFAVMVCILHGKPVIYLLPMASFENETEISMTVADFGTIEDDLAQMVADAKEKFGVEILFGSEGNDFILSDYVGGIAPSVFNNYCAVKDVCDVLSLYPDGFFREMSSDGYLGVRIYLCNSIYGSPYAGVPLAGGVASASDGYLIVALDIKDAYIVNLPHEISHLIDYHLEAKMQENGISLEDFWKEQNPSGSIADGYSDYSQLIRYTLDYETNANNVWFPRSYSRTRNTEDRAVLMETMFTRSTDSIGASIFEYPHIHEKAKAYCELLRTYFSTCASVEGDLYWEEALK